MQAPQSKKIKITKKQLVTMAFGKVIKKLISKSKLSSRAIAYSIDLSKTTILQAQKGELDPQLTTLYKIAVAFNMKPSDLLNMLEEELPQNFSFED